MDFPFSAEKAVYFSAENENEKEYPFSAENEK